MVCAGERRGVRRVDDDFGVAAAPCLPAPLPPLAASRLGCMYMCPAVRAGVGVGCCDPHEEGLRQRRACLYDGVLVCVMVCVCVRQRGGRRRGSGWLQA